MQLSSQNILSIQVTYPAQSFQSVCALFPDASMEAHRFSRGQNLTPIERVDILGVPVPRLET
jgi:hypothetical protein